MLASFLCGLPVGSAFAWLCVAVDKKTLIVDVVTALLAVVTIVVVVLSLVSGDRQEAIFINTFFLVFFGPPVAGFAVGAFATYGIAKFAKRR
jgi:hypothetical protein